MNGGSMMKMKLGLAGLLLGGTLLLAGCSGGATSSTTPTVTATPTATTTAQTQTTAGTSQQSAVSSDQAKATALGDAGVNEADAWGLTVEAGTENGKNVYEVNFSAGGNEYDYDIDSATGGIVKKNVETAD